MIAGGVRLKDIERVLGEVAGQSTQMFLCQELAPQQCLDAVLSW
ncbi:MAG: hypothetical protein QOE33_2326 [Acidobacteriota bacterium]|nr:hypothetical protein [Acidobacteriota bacterium]